MKGPPPPVPVSSGAPTPTPGVIRPPLQFGETWDDPIPNPHHNNSSVSKNLTAGAGGAPPPPRYPTSYRNSMTAPHTPTSRPLARRSVSVERIEGYMGYPPSPGSSEAGGLGRMGQNQAQQRHGLPYERSRGDERRERRPHKKPTIGFDAASFVENPALCAVALTLISVIIIIASLPFSLFFCIKVVQEYERAVIFRLGRLVTGGARGPGIFFIIPCIDTYSKVDLRTVSFDVPPQEILSRDSVTVAVDAVVYFRISNAIASVSNVEDYARSTRLLAATTLRNVLGTKNLSEILSERESISHMIQTALDDATDNWGVKVERVEIKDVRLPVLLQRAMAAEAEAAREARAKVIAAEGEQRASRALKEAAEVIACSPAALQLRYLQTLNSIASEKNSTIVFPVPLEMFRGYQYYDEVPNKREYNDAESHHNLPNPLNPLKSALASSISNLPSAID